MKKILITVFAFLFFAASTGAYAVEQTNVVSDNGQAQQSVQEKTPVKKDQKTTKQGKKSNHKKHKKSKTQG